MGKEMAEFIDANGNRLPYVPSAGPSEISAMLASTQIADLTTTRQQVSYPTGAKWVQITYKLLPGATATANQYAKVVFNAASDADASGKLATTGAFVPILQGDDVTFAFSDNSLCTRIDVLTDQAVGSEKTLMRFLAGV